MEKKLKKTEVVTVRMESPMLKRIKKLAVEQERTVIGQIRALLKWALERMGNDAKN